MFKKTVNYTNFNGESRTKDLYFHLSKSDLTEIVVDGTKERMDAALASQNKMALMAELRAFVARAIGARSEDGESFDKSPETVKLLTSSAAYDQLMSELMIDEDITTEFITNLVPAELREALLKDLEAAKAKNPLDEPKTVNHGSGHEHVLNGPAWIRENRPPNKAEMRSIKPEHMKLAFAMRASQKVVEAQPAWLREKRAPTNEEYLAMDETESLRVLQALQDGEIEL